MDTKDFFQTHNKSISNKQQHRLHSPSQTQNHSWFNGLSIVGFLQVTVRFATEMIKI